MNRKLKDISFLLIAFVCIIVINVLGITFFARFDLTDEKRFTLSAETIKHLESLEDEVVITVYLEGDLNSDFLKLQRETKEMLEEFKAYAGSNLSYEFVNPYSLSDDPNKVLNQLAKKGLQPTGYVDRKKSGNEQTTLFPGAVMYYKNKPRAVGLLNTDRQLPLKVAIKKGIESLEFVFSNSLRKLLYPNKAKIAFTEGHGEFEDQEIYQFASALQEYYTCFTLIGDTLTKGLRKEITRVNLKEQNGRLDIHALDEYEAIVVAGPTQPFNDEEAYLIDQFVMNGGKVLWALDGNTANMDSLETGVISMAFPLQTKLHDILYKYGARINTNLVQDLTCGPVPVFDGYQGNQPRFTRYPWVYDPLLISENNHLLNTNLDPIKTNFASTIDTIPVPGVKKTPFIKTSKNSKTLRTPIRISLQTAVRGANTQSFDDGSQFIGTLLEGKFNSYYTNLLPQELKSNPEFRFKPTSPENKMIVLSDASIIKNEVSQNGTPYPLSANKFYRDLYYDNKKLVLNMMNYLMDDIDLIPMRSRRIELRLLDKKRSEQEGDFWKIINLIGPILTLLLIVLPIIFIRKYKYTK